MEIAQSKVWHGLKLQRKSIKEVRHVASAAYNAIQQRHLLSKTGNSDSVDERYISDIHINIDPISLPTYPPIIGRQEDDTQTSLLPQTSRTGFD